MSFLNSQLQSKTAKRRSKRKGRSNPLRDADSMEWANLTPKILWSQIKSELKSYYDWDLQAESLESVVDQFSLQKISLLRYAVSCKLKNKIELNQTIVKFLSEN